MDNSFLFVHTARTFRCWTEVNNPPTDSSAAAPSSTCWCCDVGGKRYRLFEAFHDDRATPAKRAELELRLIAEVQRQDAAAN
jgi:hypothetical protein